MAIYQTLICVFTLVFYAKAKRDAKEICTDPNTRWHKDLHVLKSSGAMVKVDVSELPLEVNWYEAASCCRYYDYGEGPLTLMSISDIKELDAYWKLLKQMKTHIPYVAWSDIHGFGKSWRNLKGNYVVDEKLFRESQEPPRHRPIHASPGDCKHVEGHPIYPTTQLCGDIMNSRVICEHRKSFSLSIHYTF